MAELRVIEGDPDEVRKGCSDCRYCKFWKPALKATKAENVWH